MTQETIRRTIDQFRSQRVLVIGDVMLDRFVWGDVSRISPEAPVPVVDVRRESLFPGGAANVARNLLPFAGGVDIVGLAGGDDDASSLRNLLVSKGIQTDGLVSDPGRRTIVKTRIVAQNQQVVRIDREDRHPTTEDVFAAVLDCVTRAAAGADALIIEDYGKGLVTQKLADTVAEAASANGKILTVDPNPGNLLQWKRATLVKPNRHEAFLAAGIPEREIGPEPADDPTVAKIAAELFRRWDTEHLLITLGHQGMILCSRDDAGRRLHHIPTRAREVFDVSGAGDTAIALLTLSLTAGVPPETAAEIANHASGVVIGKFGTATLEPDELVASFD